MQRKISENLKKELELKLKDKKERLTKIIDNLKQSDPFADPDHAIDNAATDTDAREEIGHEDVAAKIELLERNLKEINHALRKVKNGKYGICEKCGQEVSPERLKLVPEARYCLRCK